MATSKLARKYNPYLSSVAGRVGFTIGAEASNVINVAMQLKDENGKALAQQAALQCWLSPISTGLRLLQQPPNTYLQQGTNGQLIPTQRSALEGVSVVGGLAIYSTPTQFKTTTQATYTIGGQTLTKAATNALTFTAAHVVSANKFGVVLVQIDAAGAISTKVPSATQAYTSAVLALAALPLPDVNKAALGYIAIAANTGAWTANTSDMTNGSGLTTATFVDAITTSQVPVAFTVLTDSLGRCDFNVKDTTQRSFYVAVMLPDGSVSVSSAVAFA